MTKVASSFMAEAQKSADFWTDVYGSPNWVSEDPDHRWVAVVLEEDCQCCAETCSHQNDEDCEPHTEYEGGGYFHATHLLEMGRSQKKVVKAAAAALAEGKRVDVVSITLWKNSSKEFSLGIDGKGVRKEHLQNPATLGEALIRSWDK